MLKRIRRVRILDPQRRIDDLLDRVVDLQPAFRRLCPLVIPDKHRHDPVTVECGDLPVARPHDLGRAVQIRLIASAANVSDWLWTSVVDSARSA